jgi:hypothetical protein
MRKLTLLVAVVGLISCYGMNAEAGAPTWNTGTVTSDHYVGHTDAKTTGAAGGILGMNNLCQSDSKFGPTAHICTASEYFSTSGTLQGDAAVEKWVQPSVSNCFYSPADNPPVLCEVPTIGFDNPNAYIPACANWSSDSSSAYGTAVVWVGTSDASMLRRVDCKSKLPVACCAP